MAVFGAGAPKEVIKVNEVVRGSPDLIGLMSLQEDKEHWYPKWWHAYPWGVRARPFRGT